MSGDTLVTLHGRSVLACAADGPKLCEGADALRVIAEAAGYGAQLVVVPVRRLAGEFFTLRTGVAGELVQKFVNHRLPLVVVGDISVHVARSAALRDFVAEANAGHQLWFVDTLSELEEKLRRQGRPATA
ncbi:DUF4180 domain-containing protein [Micromonospora coxensis]|uniref:DUF4180 domain-containing protein n=1 Tax=Micromonospora coxensis TaxID=356852 RepID=A0A1C5JGT9_9ACTN|nr:DUF4180 domain-containing protein [Micromonospora coxensis]SCG69449.1 protein of unknown function [Micromonospora coxensis]